jgi:hypothetical protein
VLAHSGFYFFYSIVSLESKAGCSPTLLYSSTRI